jgi:TolA-binding protein
MNQALKTRGLVVLAIALSMSAYGCGSEKSPLAEGAPTDGNEAIDPNAPDEQLFQQALAQYDAGDYAGAQPLFDELLATYPDSPRHDNAGYLAGRCRYEQTAYADAIVVFEQTRAEHPDSLLADSVAYFIGRSHYELGDFAGARIAFADSIAVDPAGTYADNAQYYLGRSDYELGDLTTARDELSVLEQNYPDSTYIDNARYYVGRCDFDAGEFQTAISDFARVLEVAASTYADDARYYTGRAQYSLGELDTALASFTGLRTDLPDSQYVDNALYYEVRIHVDAADCAAASQTLDNLAMIGGTYATRAADYMTANGC